MVPETEKCSRKDKRLLVLLSFGCLVILFHLFRIHLPDRQLSGMWQWHQNKIHSSDVLYRVEISDADPGSSMPASVVLREPGKFKTRLSPRASFMLGLAFPINNADREDLTMLPGIGPKLSSSIVQYRETNGPVTNSRHLTKIPGIGIKIANRISPLLTFEVQ